MSEQKEVKEDNFLTPLEKELQLTEKQIRQILRSVFPEDKIPKLEDLSPVRKKAIKLNDDAATMMLKGMDLLHEANMIRIDATIKLQKDKEHPHVPIGLVESLYDSITFSQIMMFIDFSRQMKSKSMTNQLIMNMIMGTMTDKPDRSQEQEKADNDSYRMFEGLFGNNDNKKRNDFIK